MEKSKLVEVSNEEQEVLRKYNEDKRKALLVQLSEVNSKIEKLGGQVKSKSQTSIAFTSGFPSKGSKPAKIIFIIRDLKKFSMINEIINRYADYQPSVKANGSFDREEYRTSYGAILSKIKTGDLTRYKDANGLFRYGLAEWTQDGVPKEEFK